MPTVVREVVVQRAAGLDAYRSVEGVEPLLAALTAKGRHAAHLLGPHTFWMLNSTETGGGVAEMMPRLCSILTGLGVDTRWLVLDPGDPAFFRVTKGLHNLLHGEPAAAFDLEDARTLYERVSREGCASLWSHVGSGDVLAVHDPQPAGLGAYLPPERRPSLLWRCHIGTALRNERTRMGWAFLRPYLAPYARLLFSAESYIPAEHLPRSGILHPGIDPVTHKNRELRPYKLIGVLRAAGLLAGPPLPAWAQFAARAQRFADGRWVTEPVPGLLYGPTIVQVSRFDRLKGFQYLLPAFERLVREGPERAERLRVDTQRARSELECVQLLLAGPDPAGVSDDPEGAEVLEGLARQHRSLPPELAARVHLVRLPMADLRQNALAVNALQRVAATVVQNSLQEGFGLTVAEALWKRTPVVAANVGGLSVQVRHGADGLLVNDPTDPEAIASALLQVLAFPKEAEAMAASGRARVRENFLMLRQVERWLDELIALLSPAPGRALASDPADAGLSLGQ